MIGIIVVSHAKLAMEFLETVRLIMGEQKDFIGISFSSKESIETLRSKIFSAIEPYRASGCLLLTDVLGGSCTNVCTELLSIGTIRILTGVNLPMILEAIQHRENLELETLSQKVRAGAIRGILDLKEFYEEKQKRKT
ncbi:hypothetical protein HYY75_10675 [bacterium]|nr:hypothetical protein [bacterium]